MSLGGVYMHIQTFLLSLPASEGEHIWSKTPFHRDALPQLMSTSTGAILNLWNHEQNETFSFSSCFHQVFCHSDGKLTHTTSMCSYFNTELSKWMKSLLNPRLSVHPLVSVCHMVSRDFQIITYIAAFTYEVMIVLATWYINLLTEISVVYRKHQMEGFFTQIELCLSLCS